MLEDDVGELHLRGLTAYDIDSEEEALNLLFLGNVNRVTSETPMNKASSRSHCIFTFSLEVHPEGSEGVVRKSKLHLVDLAGSERIYKYENKSKLTNKEGMYINRSLHHLELVILSLQQRGMGKRSHVPYRNSTVTNILRDSLGGNCKTVFIINASSEKSEIDETLSTFRFAERCASIKVHLLGINRIALQCPTPAIYLKI